jgi:hypothetical protein
VTAASSARELLAILAAAPRPAGSAAERDARAHCAQFLAALGFAVREEPFEFSAAPGRYATPVGGLCAMLLMGAAGYLGYLGNSAAAVILLLAGGALVLGAALWIARRGVLDLPLARRHGVNLVATRGDPELWLVAHLDSKSQPVPIVARAAGVTVCLTAWMLGVVIGVSQLAGGELGAWWPWVGGAGVLAALPVAASTVGARSPGALDNASGVCTVLLAAEMLPPGRTLGVLLTSAEELGLAGARAWAAVHRPRRAINVDGVDDRGGLRLSYTSRRPRALLAALFAASAAERQPATAGLLIPGVLVDGVALADAGWEAVTVSKGTFRTVARIHTPRDTVHGLEGDGIARTAGVIARALQELG